MSWQDTLTNLRMGLELLAWRGREGQIAPDDARAPEDPALRDLWVHERIERRIAVLAAAGRDPRVEPHWVLRTLFERARRAGFPVRNCYVVRWPLVPGQDGEYEAASGDLWIRYHPHALVEMVRSLLHELAHAEADTPVARPHGARAGSATAAGAPPITSLRAEGEDEARTIERAAQLARRWGVGQVYTRQAAQAEIQYRLAISEQEGRAAELAGSLSPQVARAAHAAVRQHAAKLGIGDIALDQALRAMPRLTDLRLLDFDRSRLRAWEGNWQSGGGFGPLALWQPDDAASALLLCTQLMTIARARVPVEGWQLSNKDAGAQRLYIGRIASSADLQPVLAALNAALLDRRTVPARAAWHLYGASPADSVRYYRLTIAYDSLFPTEVWAVVGPRIDGLEDIRRAEAALQRYIAGWSAACPIVAMSPYGAEIRSLQRYTRARHWDA